MYRALAVGAILLAAPLVVVPMPAQTGTGTITGAIADATGAVIPGARVVVVNTDTNFTFNSESNAAGLFRVGSLNPGPYRVTIEAEGFRSHVTEDVALRAGANFLVTAVLEIGTVTEQVEVTARTPLLETETSSTGTNVEGEAIYRLPVYQRKIHSVLRIVPGVSHEGYGDGDVGAYNISGQRRSATAYFEDGVLGNDQGAGTTQPRTLQNATAEIRVFTTVVPAEYGHTASGVVDVVKKTGTNELHGHGSFFGRNRPMQHRLFFDQLKNEQPRPGAPDGLPSMFMLPDATVGGPVVIPKLYDGRNKTFFFFGYQKLIEKKTAQVFATTPTLEMKAGDFSFGGVGNPIFDPATTRQTANGTWVRDPMPNNQIPRSRFNPVSRRIIDIDPWVAPNDPDTPNANGPVENISVGEAARVFFEDFSGRLDHQFTSQTKAYFTWTYWHRNGLGRPINVKIGAFDASQGREAPFDGNIASTGFTHIFNPSTFIDARFGFVRTESWRIQPSLRDAGLDLGIPNLDNPDLAPQFGTGNRYSADSIYGLNVTGNNSNTNETLYGRADISKIVRNHSFKFGYELMQLRLNSSATLTPNGAFQFSNMTAGLQANGQPSPRTGNTFAGFLFGEVRQATFTRELAAWHPRSTIHSMYLQDDWKFSPNLTINLGLRYSNESQFNTQSPGLLTNFDPSATDPVTGRLGGLIHPSNALAPRDGNNFQPRLGLAWHPLQKWVFRAGFGLTHIDIKYPQSRAQFDEFAAISNFERAPGDPRAVFALNAVPAQSFPIETNGTSRFQGTNFSQRNADFWDPNLKNAYAMNWNASIQYEFANNWLLDTSYQGSSGVGLLERWEINAFPVDFGANDPALRAAAFARPQDFRPYPHFGSIRHRSNHGHSTYHASTVKLERRMTSGLMIQSFYTFSKAINSQDEDNDGTGVASIANRRLEKAVADFNRSHRFVAAMTYELPFGRGKRWGSGGGALQNALLGDWEFSFITTAESSNPLDVTFAGAPGNFFPTYVGLRRPNLVSDDKNLIPGWYEAVKTSANRFDANQIAPVLEMDKFAYPDSFTAGNLGRNSIKGIPLYGTDFSMAKNIRIGERWRIVVRYDLQNAFHNYNFDPPTTNFDTRARNAFGKVRTDPRTASLGGQPLQNFTLAVYF